MTQLHTTTGKHNQCRTPYAVAHGLVLLMMDVMMPETCWGRSFIINIRLIATCWYFCLFTLQIYFALIFYLWTSGCLLHDGSFPGSWDSSARLFHYSFCPFIPLMSPYFLTQSLMKCDSLLGSEVSICFGITKPSSDRACSRVSNIPVNPTATWLHGNLALCFL